MIFLLAVVFVVVAVVVVAVAVAADNVVTGCYSDVFD